MVLVHVNSRNRLPGGDFYNFQVQLDVPRNCYTSCSLVNVCLPQTAFNISADLGNNIFYFRDSTGDKSITFPDGTYDLGTFTTMYQNLMDQATTLTYSASHCYYIIMNTHTPFLQFQAPVDTTSSNFQIYWSKMPKLAYLLGFEPVDSGYDRTLKTGTFAYNFSPPEYVHLYLGPGFPRVHFSNNGEVPSVFPLNLYSNSGTIVGIDNPISVDGKQVFKDGTLVVSLFRPEGGCYKILSDWSFTLKLE